MIDIARALHWSRRLVAVAVSALPCLAAAQPLTLGAPFSDHMVIQRNQPVPVWGTAAPDRSIAVSLGDHWTEARADADGNWMAVLPAVAARESLSLEVTSDEQSLTVANVAAGDVFLCSGQSNMEFPLGRTALAERERHLPVDSGLRLLKVPLAISNISEQAFGRPARWRPGQVDTASFSAICLLFGREIARERGIVVGLVNASYGGTPIEGWMNRAAMVRAGQMDRWIELIDAYSADPVAADARFGEALERYWTRANSPWRGRMGFSNLYNAMIAPLGPTRFAAVLWYQGENNANGSDTRQAYRQKLAGLLAGWRDRFGQDLPFMIIQLSSFGPLTSEAGSSSWAEIREAQRLVAKDDPKAALVVTIDVGERLDIHPPIKKPVALRASKAARVLVYGEPVGGSGPQAVSARQSGGSVSVTFTEVDAALFAASWGRPGPFQLCSEADACIFADAEFAGDTIDIAVPDGFEPRLVRYCWAAAPICNVFDGPREPLGPFELAIQGDRDAASQPRKRNR